MQVTLRCHLGPSLSLNSDIRVVIYCRLIASTALRRLDLDGSSLMSVEANLSRIGELSRSTLDRWCHT